MTNRLKKVLVQKLGEALVDNLSLADFNKTFLLLDTYNSNCKVIPYGVFENEDNRPLLDLTSEGKLFSKWLDSKTAKIEMDFNKGRKLVRVFKETVEGYDGALVFNLSVNSIFVTTVSSFFMVKGNYVIEDNEKIEKALSLIRKYIISVLYIDLLNGTENLEGLVSEFLNSSKDNLLDNIIEFLLQINE